jgi:uncharacterized protein YndB with AHSA1/START domain
MTTQSTETNPTQDRELWIERVFDAAPELVFKAWTKEEQLARWWGPKGFSIKSSEFEFKEGGTWRFIMIGPDGTEYPNHVVFREIQPYNRLLLEHFPGPHFFITASFRPEGKGTRMRFHQLFDDAKTRDQVRPYAEPGNRDLMDKLEALLSELKTL